MAEQHRTCRLFAASAALALVMLVPVSVTAQTAERHYAIPTRPLAGALSDFARESGIDIFYEGRIAAGLRSAPVNGVYGGPAALRALLEGTGLIARFTGHNAAIVYRAGTPAPIAAVPTSARAPALQLTMGIVRAPMMIGADDTGAFDGYARRAQADIHAILREDAALQRDRFVVEVAVGIDRAGTIYRVALLRGSGRSEWDGRISRLLNGRRLSRPPPAALRKPLRFEIVSYRAAKPG